MNRFSGFGEVLVRLRPSRYHFWALTALSGSVLVLLAWAAYRSGWAGYPTLLCAGATLGVAVALPRCWQTAVGLGPWCQQPDAVLLLRRTAAGWRLRQTGPATNAAAALGPDVLPSKDVTVPFLCGWLVVLAIRPARISGRQHPRWWRGALPRRRIWLFVWPDSADAGDQRRLRRTLRFPAVDEAARR